MSVSLQTETVQRVVSSGIGDLPVTAYHLIRLSVQPCLQVFSGRPACDTAHESTLSCAVLVTPGFSLTHRGFNQRKLPVGLVLGRSPRLELKSPIGIMPGFE